MSRQNIFYWYKRTITALKTQAETWKWNLEMHDFSFPKIIDELAEVSTASIHIYTYSLVAAFPLREQQQQQQLSTQRKLLYLIVDKQVSGPYLKQVYVTESVAMSFLQNDRQAGPLV
jgi:hypothetical protein